MTVLVDRRPLSPGLPCPALVCPACLPNTHSLPSKIHKQDANGSCFRTQCNHLFCESCAFQHFGQSQACPSCGVSLEEANIFEVTLGLAPGQFDKMMFQVRVCLKTLMIVFLNLEFSVSLYFLNFCAFVCLFWGSSTSRSIIFFLAPVCVVILLWPWTSPTCNRAETINGFKGEEAVSNIDTKHKHTHAHTAKHTHLGFVVLSMEREVRSASTRYERRSIPLCQSMWHWYIRSIYTTPSSTQTNVIPKMRRSVFLFAPTLLHNAR